MRPSLLLLGAAVLAAPAAAQVTQFTGSSPNLTTALDFDNPVAPAGAIASTSTVFTSVGITSITLVGSWAPGGDTLTAGSNVDGQCFISQNGALTVAAAPQVLDSAQVGAGFDIVLANAVDEFQCIFADQVNHGHSVELFNGATSLGVGAFVYGGAFPNPPHYWRGPSPFNRVRITFNTAGIGGGIDELAFGNGPPPPPANCVETPFAGGNSGNVGGSVYFDLTVTQNVTISGVETNFLAAVGLPVGVVMYTTPTSYIGNEANMAAWTQVAVDDGTATSAGGHIGGVGWTHGDQLRRAAQPRARHVRSRTDGRRLGAQLHERHGDEPDGGQRRRDALVEPRRRQQRAVHRADVHAARVERALLHVHLDRRHGLLHRQPELDGQRRRHRGDRVGHGVGEQPDARGLQPAAERVRLLLDEPDARARHEPWRQPGQPLPRRRDRSLRRAGSDQELGRDRRVLAGVEPDTDADPDRAGGGRRGRDVELHDLVPRLGRRDRDVELHERALGDVQLTRRLPAPTHAPGDRRADAPAPASPAGAGARRSGTVKFA